MQCKDCVNERSKRHNRKVNGTTRNRGVEGHHVRVVASGVERVVELAVGIGVAAAAVTIDAAASN